MKTIAPAVPLSEKVVLTPTEFSTLFGRHHTWAYRQIYAGKIKVITNLGRMMIPRSEVDRLLQDKEIYTGKK
jgi:predicted site-specific integrase-resolvase